MNHSLEEEKIRRKWKGGGSSQTKEPSVQIQGGSQRLRGKKTQKFGPGPVRMRETPQNGVGGGR